METIEKSFTERTREKNRQLQDFRRFIAWKAPGSFISKYLGCDIGFLREWIESKFINGMNWGNYGEKWVIDHIVPFRVFNVFDEKELLIVWNYRNLMPLLKEDNLKKEGNVFFAFELFHVLKDTDLIYAQLFERIKPETIWMVKYIDNYIDTRDL